MNIRLIAWGIASVMALAAGSAQAIDDTKAQEIAKKSGCVACHALDKKVYGPAFKDVAAKHKGEADAVTKLEKAVRVGSKGTYGAGMMPPNPAARIGDQELHALLEWVLTK